FGRVAIEAMARGVPVVTSRSGGLPEVVQDQVTGLTVEYGDADALRRAVASACGDEALRERLRRRASEDVRRRFSLPRYQQQLVDVVTDLVEDA
ncbi:MAG: glycosyltransferase, partial [Planctomycetota bacterium]